MKFFFSFFDRKEAPRRRRKTDRQTRFYQFLESSPSIAFVIFLIVTGSFITLSTIGVSPLGVSIFPNQPSPVTVQSTLDFTYESPLETERERERRVQRIIPTFRPSLEHYESFAEHFRTLFRDLNELAESWEDLSEDEQDQRLDALIRNQDESFSYTLTRRNLRMLIQQMDTEERNQARDQSLRILRQLHQQGIYLSEDFRTADQAEGQEFIIFQREVLSTDQPAQHLTPRTATRTLNERLEGDFARPFARALTDICRPAVVPNLIFDEERTELLRQRERDRTRPVQVTVRSGQTLVEAGQLVTPEQHERLQVYRDLLIERQDSFLFLNEQVVHRALLILGLLLSAVVYIRIEDRETLKSNSRLFLLGLLAIFNLALIWLLVYLGTLPGIRENPTFLHLIPYMAPTALAPLMVAILVGQRPAIYMALLVSFLASLIFGLRIETFVTAFLSSLVGIYFCQQIRYRSRLVRAALLSGIVVAASALVFGIIEFDWKEWQESLLVPAQIGSSLVVGFLTGIILVGILPLFESLFRRTTDISLLELSDTNHPLLKKLQIVAPGSYHHSLMVANLSENAAQSIGANGLLCRVCALFHDIGKTVKPEYFIENQQNGINPHLDRNPSFSALIIKSHVKEGVDMALDYRLPKVIIDVIKQHHGTSLIQYFYHLAKTQGAPEEEAEAGKQVSEATYRYDGPKPHFRESAIILMADSIEAASRSLKKVNPQAIDELIEKIVQDRINDDQFDECPLTFAEIAEIQRSFSRTLLNMFHSRIEYPDDKKKDDAKKDSKNQ
ncbi:MAG: HDIG domain-containing protein [Opitutales bacterium]|nr:HDIG domain-containing protein [Opitutales bacterium]